MTQPAVFLDRDGTLIEHYDYLTDPEQLRLLPRVGAAMRRLRSQGYSLVLVTNQSAVARGLLTEGELGTIHDRLKALLAEQGAYLDGLYYCPHHPEAPVDEYRHDCDERKPRPGMLLRAAAEMGLDLGQSWMIGDDSRDIQAGAAAGCRTILLDSHSTSTLVRREAVRPDFRAVNLQEAANIIMHQRQQAREKNPPELPDRPRKAKNTAPTRDEEPSPEDEPSDSPPAAVAEESPQTAEAATELESEQAVTMVTVEETPPAKDAADDKTAPPPPAPTVAPAPPPPTESALPTAAPVKKKRQRKGGDPNAAQTQALLRDILRELKAQHRQDDYAEFSIAKLMAGLTQMVTLLFLVLAFYFHVQVEPDPTTAQSCLLAAVVFQAMTLALLILRH